MSVWWAGRWCRFQFQYLGKMHYGGKFPTEEAAFTAQETLKEELRQPAQAISSYGMVVSSYLTHCERKFVTKTWKYKVYVFEKFLHHIGDIDMTQITTQQVESYLQTRKTNNNYNMHRKDLSALFNYAKKICKLPILNPCDDLERMPHTPDNRIIPTEEEVVHIIQAATDDEKDLIMILVQTLARISEILNMKWTDVDFKRRTVTLWTRKRRGGELQSDVMAMNDDLYAVLKRRADLKIDKTYVFINLKTGQPYKHRPKIMDTICKRAGCEPIGMRHLKLKPSAIRAFEKRHGHLPKGQELYIARPRYYGFSTFRHFMATLIADEEGTSIASGLLRHQRQSTTDHYLHRVSGSQRAAVKRIEGRFNDTRT